MEVRLYLCLGISKMSIKSSQIEVKIMISEDIKVKSNGGFRSSHTH
jgi:hypothetical protein